MVPIKLLAALVLYQLCALGTSQPCLYNYTIGNGSPVTVTQSAPVCLICSNTAYTSWTIGGSPTSPIVATPYILYVATPTTTFLFGPNVRCTTSNGASFASSFVNIAAPVVPQLVTYVNESDTLSLACSNVITASSPAVDNQKWLDPFGNFISYFTTASVPYINRTDAGNYTCTTQVVPNANGLSVINGSTTVVVYYLNITSPLPSVLMPQGLSVQLNCSFNGLPVPTITWTLPSGSVLTSSQGRYSLQSTSTSTTLTIAPLVGGGDSGTYTCTASNLWGVASSTVQLTVQVPPDAPSNLAVTSTDNSSISLSWSNGFNGYSNLSAVVISYEVDRYPQDGTRSQPFSMGTSAILTGLYPYSNYTIHVRLTNAVGLVSNPSNITATTASLRPTAPSITSVVANNSTQLTIAWMAPPISSSTTAPLTSWTISYTCFSSWNPSCPSGTITSIPPSSSSYSISGLVKGSNYTFVVRGVNSGGVGDLSLPATNQTAVDPPTAVINLFATVMTTTSVNLTWSPPGDNGGQAIVNYIIQYGIAGTSNVTMTTTTQIMLSELTPNSWYQFSVTANNGLYNGVLSSTVVLLIGYPIMPSAVSNSAVTDTYATISWTLQTPAGFIDNFIVSYRTISSQTWTMATSSLLNYTRSYLLTGLTPNTTYVVGVATKNAIQNPPYSNYTITTFTTAAVPYQTGPSGTIYAGIPFNLTCNLQAGYPGVMTWYRAATSLPSSAAIKGNTLVFTNPQPTDGGTYTCAYVNSSARSLPLTIAIMTFTPSVTGPGGSPSTSVTSGTSFTLMCNVGSGYSTSVVWSRVGYSLPSSAMANGSSLIFTNPQPGDSGNYVCSFQGSAGASSAEFIVSINADMTTIIIIVVVVGGVALLLLLIAISVLVCYCCFCRSGSSKGKSNNKWTPPVDTTKPKPTTAEPEPAPSSRPHLLSFHTPAKPAGTLMHGGNITDELPESYSGATTFGTTNRQSSSSQPSNTPTHTKEDTDHMQYAALSFQAGAPPPHKTSEAKGKSAMDDLVTYSSVQSKGEMPLLSDQERHTSASPEGPHTSMV